MSQSNHEFVIPVYRVFDVNDDRNVYFQDLEVALEFAELVDGKVYKLVIGLDSAERLFG